MTRKKLTFALLVLGGGIAFIAYSFVSVSLTERRIERAVKMVLDGPGNLVKDELIRAYTVRIAAMGSLELDSDDIQIARERHPGESVLIVDVHHPVTVSYLGLERTLQSSVTVRKVFEVDEVAKARRRAQEQRQADEERQ